MKKCILLCRFKDTMNDHNHLLKIVRKTVWDYEPFGSISRKGEGLPDCSCGCKFYLPLKGKLGSDWGVCSNAESIRCGLLTFEHQGCQDFEKE